MKRLLKRAGFAVGALLLCIGGFFVYQIGPSNIIGMIRYDQREEGKLRLGDKAPDVSLVSLNGREQTTLGSFIGPKPLVLIFGSFT